MRQTSFIGVACAAVVLMAAGVAGAGSFTVNVSPLIETGGWNGTSFLASNPTPVPLVQTLPTCDYANNTCDRVTVTVSNVTQAYLDANPSKRIIFQIGWTDANADFDLYVTNAADNARLTASASSSNPEIATLPIELGTHTYTLRIVPYTVVPLDSYAGSVSLAVPASAPPPPNLFGLGQYVLGTDVFSCNFHLTGIDSDSTSHAEDAEPAVKFDPAGNAFVVSNSGAGLGIWRANDLCGQGADFITVDLRNGGGDGDVEAASVLNANGFYNIYASSLHSTDALVNFNSSVSYDGGRTFLTTPISDATPLNDRQWNAAYGRDILLLSYRSANTGNQQFCVRARAVTGAPLAFGPSSPVYTDPNTIGALIAQTGTMVCDQRPGADTSAVPKAGPNGEGTAYHAFTINGRNVWVGISRDFGTTWKDARVFTDPTGASYGHIFTWCAVDQAGNVYVAFSDDHNVYYCVSENARTSDTPTWSKPIRVNDGDMTKTAALPAMAAGSAGRVVFTWYGSSTPTAHESDAEWRVFHARCDNALDALHGGVPKFEQTLVSDHVVHNGDLCEGGTLGCPVQGSRALLDDFEIDVNPIDGGSLIAYTDHGLAGGTYISRELAGGSAIAGRTVTDRTDACPVSVAGCVPIPTPPGTPCYLPGLQVAADSSGDAGAEGTTADDIREIRFCEPHQTDGVERITLSMRMEGLDPSNLPLDRVFEILFTVPGAPDTTFLVGMTTCDPTAIPSFEFGFIQGGATNTSIKLGAAQGAVLADGTMRITMPKSIVGTSTTTGDVLWHVPIGATLKNITGETYLLAGAACHGLLEPLDAAGGTGANKFKVYGNCDVAAVGPPASLTPGRFGFALAGANPFHGQTTLAYALPARAHVRIDVFSITGQNVATLADRTDDAGIHTVPFDMAAGGRHLPAGIYMVRIDAGPNRAHLRLMALR
ncbi:MAG: exo-alpha-sialidase [Candidatus Eisenbacteria bacterium]|nr:exo-alpha-sialidase [Candidatus Eisenbacteria bacterium]